MADQSGPQAQQPTPEISKKLDGNLRRLLRMSDSEILEAVEREQARVAAKKAEIARRLKPTSATAPAREHQAAERLRQARVRELREHPLVRAVIPDRFAPAPVRIRAIVEFSGNRDDLLAMGLEVRSQAHDVFTVVGTREQLAELAAQPATRRMETPMPVSTTLRSAAGQAEIDQVHEPRADNPAGYTGRNVIVGVIDTPLDVTHHGFQDPEGSHGTRVRWMWVQRPSVLDAAGDPVDVETPDGQQTPAQFHLADPSNTPDFTGLDYGIVYTEDAINDALALASPYGDSADQICCTPQPAEHGTHVAGIAAGNGHTDDWAGFAFDVGAAPESIVVHVSHRDHDSESIMNALAFILAVADFHGLPVVVNSSNGGSWGPHMGTRPKDYFVDNQLNSFTERVFVNSAGNGNHLDAGSGAFRKGTVATDGTESFTLTSTSTDGEDVWVDIWWHVGQDLDYRIGFVAGVAAIYCAWQGPGEDYSNDDLGGFAVQVDRQVDEDAGMQGIRIFVGNANDARPLTVELRPAPESGDINYFAWVCPHDGRGRLDGATQHEFTLNSDSCSRSVLAVGACSNRRNPAPLAGEQVTYYSGAGPTLDGRIKPEIVAVGGNLTGDVIAPASDQASGYVGKHGTSMASPLVAGAVALLYEEARLPDLGFTLNHDTVKALLINHAYRLSLHLVAGEEGYDATERNRYGYGRLRMIGPIDQMRPPVNVDLWVRTAHDDYGEQQYIGDCFCGAPDIRVYEAGSDVETTELTWGQTYDVRVTVRNLGDDDAIDASVQLRYTLPWTAPDDWTPAEGPDNAPLLEQESVDVPALGETTVEFQWRPETGEIEDVPPGTTHFCLLAEVWHDHDPLDHRAGDESGRSAWATNIKGNNNVALRNVHIV